MASRDQILNSLMKHIYDNFKPSEFTLKFKGDLELENELTPLWILKGFGRNMQDQNRIEISESKQSTMQTQRIGDSSIELVPYFIRVTLLNDAERDFFPDLSVLESALLDHEYFWVYNDLNGKNSVDKLTKLMIYRVTTSKNPIESVSDVNTDDVGTSEIKIYRIWVQNVRAA